ncbi:hypothetical protein [Solibacillus cecembensis]|uniref:hypothetical protein n=1 Tax=Solibacillus cecembensis TaxID=459347 RepID=UPI003CFD31E2
MPIVNNNNLQVIFGTGDIAIKIGCKGKTNPSVMQFVEVEKSRIGQHVEIGSNEKMKVDEAPIALVFNKIESLDVVINQLLKLRGIMGGN